MINLIKNELFKIVHKSGLYILLSFSICSIVLICFISSYEVGGTVGLDHYYEGLEENLSNYDLTDSKQLNSYIGDKTIIESYKLYKDYSIDSPEYYYIDNDIVPNIKCMNEAMYRDKDEALYNECKIMYDKQVRLLNNFDWKKVINEKITENDKIILEYTSLKNGDSLNDSELDNHISYLKEENFIFNYRLENEVPMAYTDVSMDLEDYLSNYQRYQTLELDESKYESVGEIEYKREVESNYFITKYKLENDLLLNESENHMVSNFVAIFESFDIFLVIAAIMIAGSIISEEFNKGTIKQLLLKPFSRSSILSSKIIASILAFLGFTIVYTVITMLISSIFFNGFTSLLDPIIVYDFTKSVVVELGVFEYSMLHFVCLLPAYLIIMFFTILMGIVTTNTAGTIISGFVLFTFGTLISDMILTESLALLPFIHWDFSPYLFGGLHWFRYTTFSLSFTVVFVTILLLIVLSYILFQRKDIKNQ